MLNELYVEPRKGFANLPAQKQGSNRGLNETPNVIAITGATGTLGYEVIRRLWCDGRPVKGMSLHGDEACKFYAGDVTDPADVLAWFGLLAHDYPDQPLRALITCAGVAGVSPILDQTVEEFRRILDVNVTGTWLCIREALRLGVRRIITVSSLLGGVPIGYPDRAAYIASKAAVAGMTRALAVELAPRGIAVNCVAPGHFSLMASKAKGLLEAALAKQPMGCLVTPGEVADVICYLATTAPISLTGQVIVVDGGYTVNGWPMKLKGDDGSDEGFRAGLRGVNEFLG